MRRWQGRLEELAPWFDRLVERGERVPKVGAIRVEVLAATGRTAEALDLVDRAVADGFADLAPIERPFTLGIYAMVTADQRHPGPAAALYDTLEPIRGWVAYDGDTGVRGAVDLPLGRLATELGRLDAAAHHLAEAHRLHESLRSPPLLAQTRWRRQSWPWPARATLARGTPGARRPRGAARGT